jgi:hypothetical protein
MAGKRVGCFGNAASWALGGTRQNAFARDLGQAVFQFEEKNFRRLGLSVHEEDRWQITAIWLVRRTVTFPPTQGPFTSGVASQHVLGVTLGSPVPCPAIPVTIMFRQLLHFSGVSYTRTFEYANTHQAHDLGKTVRQTTESRRQIFQINCWLLLSGLQN